MNLQFETAKCEFLENLAGSPVTLEQTREIKLPEGMPDIGRVICAWGQMILRGKEWRRDSVIATGGVMVWVLYAPENGDKVLTVADWIPIQMQWEIRDSLHDGSLRIRWDLRWMDARMLSARKLHVRFSVAGMAEALAQREEGVFRKPEVPGDVQLLEETYPLRLVTEAGERNISLDEELSMAENLPKPETVLAYHADPQVTETQVLTDRIVFRGNLHLQVLYRCAEGGVHCWEQGIPFSQFTDLSDTYGDRAGAKVETAVTSLELDLGEDGILRLRCGLLGQYAVEEQKKLCIIRDAYSPRRTVEPKLANLELPVKLDTGNQTVTGEVTLPHSPQRVVHTRFLPDVVRKSTGQDGVEFGIPGQFEALFYDESGDLQAASGRWEGAVTLPCNGGCEAECRVGKPMHLTAVPGEGSVTLRCQLPVTLECRSGEGIPMVTELKLGEEQTQSDDRPALILRKVGKDRLWDIAKTCGSTVDAICRANEITDAGDPERLLLIPVL